MNRSDFFFFHSGPFSQWSRYSIVVDGINYSCCEQYMMAQKAKMFGDIDKHDSIMKSHDPKVMKQLGRQVNNYDEAKWQTARMEVVYKANYAKFSQHPELRLALLSTGNKLIAEASPHDAVWGIGLAESASNACLPEKWPGLNLLGETLMRVRKALVEPEMLSKPVKKDCGCGEK